MGKNREKWEAARFFRLLKDISRLERWDNDDLLNFLPFVLKGEAKGFHEEIMSKGITCFSDMKEKLIQRFDISDNYELGENLFQSKINLEQSLEMFMQEIVHKGSLLGYSEREQVFYFHKRSST